MRAGMFYTDRQTDMAKLMVAFGNFAKTPKNLFADHIICVSFHYI